MTFDDIILCLRKRFQDHKFPVTNTYIFRHNWESDFFCLTNNGFAYEIEIKVSYQDFRADFRKADKHRILNRYKTGYAITRGHLHRTWLKDGTRADSTGIKIEPMETARIPNRFFYCCPEGVITPEQVPHYAGLIIVNRGADIVKRAPLLHRGVVDYSSTLLTKFYYRSLKLEQDLRLARRENEYLKSRTK